MSAFVDKARTVRFVATGQTVEGRKARAGTPVYGAWFRCYYDPGEEGESDTGGGFRRRRSSTLIARPRDMLGAAVDVKATDTVEIQSRKAGQLLMDVVGAPRPLGKARAKVIEMTLGKTNRSIST